MAPSAPQPPPPFVVEPTSAHTHTLILLHGLGSNGEKFGRELIETGISSDNLTLPQLLPGAKFIFPTARRGRATAFRRAILTQWFDTVRPEDPPHRKGIQIPGLSVSAADVLDLLRQEREVNNIPRENIILGGLSQGCATSLSVLLCLDHPIGGFVGMSGYLPFREDIDDAIGGPSDDELGPDDPFAPEEDKIPREPAVRASMFERDLLGLPEWEDPSLEKTAHLTPIFLGHGSENEKVSWSRGEAAAGTMSRAGYEVRWKCYQGLGHWYKIPDEIDDIVDFIRSAVGWHCNTSKSAVVARRPLQAMQDIL